MSNPIDLTILVDSDVTDAVRGLDDVSGAARGASTDLDKVTSASSDASSKLDRVGSSAENMDDKAGKATGAMGALAAGFSFLGAEGAAAGLESAAMASDGLSGAGQALTLILELETVQTIRAKVASVAKAAADKAQAAGTKILTASQWLLNAAMSANPIGLAIAAAIALVALFILLYKKSDKFRAIVDAVGAVGKKALGFIVGAAKDVYGWIADKLPAAWDIIVRAIKVAVFIATLQIRLIIEAIKLVVSKGPELFRAAWDKITDLTRTLKDKATGFIADITAPIRNIIDLVETLIDKIKDIDFPDVPDLNPFGRAVSTGSVASTGPVVNITIAGAIDPASVARQILDLLTRYGINLGTVAL